MAEIFDHAFLRELEALSDALLRLRGRAGEGLALRGRAAGQSEFRGHRPYAPGDDLRRLDWNAYGRLGKLFVREFERERKEHVTILLDSSRSMAPSQKHVFSRRVAAALGFLALKDEGTAALFPDAAVEGVARLGKWLDSLRAATPQETGAFSARIKAIASLARPPADLFVISDFLEALEGIAPLCALSERRCRVSLVQVLAADELAPTLRGHAALRGIEEDEVMRQELDDSTLAAYRAELEAHLEALEALAARFGWTYVLAPAESDLRALFCGSMQAAGSAP
jgi:uncharacterized protein (DUF58 family)